MTKEFKINGDFGEDEDIKIVIEKQRIHLKYGLEFSDEEFTKWAHDFVDNLHVDIQIQILCENPEIIHIFDIPDQIYIRMIEHKTPHEEEILTKQLKGEPDRQRRLLIGFRRERDRKTKEREAFCERLEKIPQGKRGAYARIE